MAQLIEIAIPDGVGPGEEFLVDFNGTQFNIAVPDGCGPGDTIQVEVPGGAEEPAADAPPEQPATQLIEIVIPDGVGPGEEFLVEFDGTQFNIAVPDGCGPGMAIQVEVPSSAPEPTAEPPAEPAAPEREMSNMKVNDTAPSSGAGRGTSKSEASSSYSSRGGSSSSHSKYSDSKYNPFDYDHYNKYDPPPKWEPEPSVFDGGFVLAGEQAEPCGDFSVGQLVQVTRTDGSWTYGKIQEYDSMGDTYTVQTKVGPKYFVERDTITDDIVTNPSDGSCAQQ
mmetsp:Transcript_7037/g.18505  ORF Transcript_7037/g.18505 Transcript_7037/m.18505 type:complete len:280 (-) Transcript_7037:555-1394(-)